MFDTVMKFIEEHNMINRGDRIVVGVSGGADSVCLLHVLFRLIPKYELALFVVHVNHGIRGEEADEDEAYVIKMCADYGINCTSVKADVRGISAKEGLSEEEAGRKVRYEAFYECFVKNKCNKIAIAHNRNDNAETILFHLFRGSGIKGLTGIKAKRDQIIRPLLSVGRDEIEKYLELNKIKYCNDRTNFTEDYSRNKIRHRIISFAREEINPKAVEHIVNTGEQLKEIENFIEKMVIAACNRIATKKDDESYELNIDELRSEDRVIQKGIIRKVYFELAKQLKDVDALHIDLILSLMDKGTGKSLNLPHGILAVRNYEVLTLKCKKDLKTDKALNEKKEPAVIFGKNSLIENNTGMVSEMELKIPGEIRIPETGQTLQIKLINYKKNMIIPKNGCTKWFDYDKIKDTVLVRTRKEGDFIQIDAAGSRKKIKSLFIDEKIPREKRDKLPLLADGPHIMWVIGGRMSEAYKVTEETDVILEINLDGGN